MDPFINRGINDCVLASTDPDQHIDHNNPPEHNHGLLTKLEAHAEEQKRIMLLLGHGVPFTGVKYILLRNRLCCKQLTTSVVSSLKVLAACKSNRTDLFGRIMVIVVRALRKHKTHSAIMVLSVKKPDLNSCPKTLLQKQTCLRLFV